MVSAFFIRVYAEHFTVDGRRSIFRLSKKVYAFIRRSTVECGESTYEKSVLSYMRRYKSDQRNKMTIKNEQKFECRIIRFDDNDHDNDVISLIVIILILKSSCHE